MIFCNPETEGVYFGTNLKRISQVAQKTIADNPESSLHN